MLVLNGSQPVFSLSFQGSQTWSDDLQLRGFGESCRSQGGEHHPANQLHFLKASESREEEEEERFQWRLLTVIDTGQKSQRWVQRCVLAGWSSSTGTEHWNLKTRELQMCLEVPSCRCVSVAIKSEGLKNVGKKLNKCMKHLTLRLSLLLSV